MESVKADECCILMLDDRVAAIINSFYGRITSFLSLYARVCY